MGLSCRMIIVDHANNVMRLANKRFERLLSQPPSDRLPQFANRRVRSAEAVVKLVNRKPVEIIRLCFHYLHFDSRGILNYERLIKDGALTAEAGMELFFASKVTGSTVLSTAHRFAARRRDHEAIWKPTPDLENAICEAALDGKIYPRL